MVRAHAVSSGSRSFAVPAQRQVAAPLLRGRAEIPEDVVESAIRTGA